MNKQIFLLFCKACRLEINNLYQALIKCIDCGESLADFNTKIQLQNLTWMLFAFIWQKFLSFCVERRHINSIKTKYCKIVALGFLNCPLVILYLLTKACSDSTKQPPKVQ